VSFFLYISDRLCVDKA